MPCQENPIMDMESAWHVLKPLWITSRQKSPARKRTSISSIKNSMRLLRTNCKKRRIFKRNVMHVTLVNVSKPRSGPAPQFLAPPSLEHLSTSSRFIQWHSQEVKQWYSSAQQEVSSDTILKHGSLRTRKRSKFSQCRGQLLEHLLRQNRSVLNGKRLLCLSLQHSHGSSLIPSISLRLMWSSSKRSKPHDTTCCSRRNTASYCRRNAPIRSIPPGHRGP